MTRLVAVTGATGFLGRRLLPVVTAQGWRVRALVRDPSASFDDQPPELIVGHLGDADALRRLCEGADVVIHAAGAIKARDRAGFMAANALGAAALAKSVSAGSRVLMISSLAARQPELSDYAASKRAGEAAMAAVLAGRLTVVRPPAIYGPGDKATLPLFRFAASSPVLPVLGRPGSRLALIHVDDAVRQIAALAAQGAAGAFALGGARPEGYDWREMLLTLAAAVGRRPGLLPVAPRLTRVAGALSAAAARISGEAPIFTPGKVRELLHADWSVTAAEAPPGVPAARFELAEGFADTVAWYRKQGWMPAAAAQPHPHGG